MYAGDTKDIKVSVTDPSGVLIDMTGSTIKWVLKKSPAITENVIEKTVGSGITIVSVGNITIRLNAVDTQSLSGNYYHGCELTDLLGNVSTLLIGIATIKNSGM